VVGWEQTQKRDGRPCEKQDQILRSQKHGPASVVHENGGIYREAAKTSTLSAKSSFLLERCLHLVKLIA
jgi:hypothetical protein